MKSETDAIRQYELHLPRARSVIRPNPEHLECPVDDELLKRVSAHSIVSGIPSETILRTAIQDYLAVHEKP